MILDSTCYDEPIYLCWLNELGGWNYYLFHKTQLHALATGDEKTYKTNIEDLANAESSNEVLSLSSYEKITAGAENLTLNDIKLIATMLDSLKVQLLMNPLTWVADGAPVWQTVIPDRGTFSTYATGQERHNIEFTFRFSDRIKQYQ